MDTGVIRKSTKTAKRRDDARYGIGVYLTQVAPNQPKTLIAYNNYDGNWSNVNKAIAFGEYTAEYVQVV